MKLHKKHIFGFSLIEILVSLFILSIITFFSIQIFSDYFKHRKQRLYMQQLYQDLKWARMEAVALNAPVALQAYNTQQNRVSDNWCDGWVIYKNSNQQTLQQASQIIKMHTGIKECHIEFSSSLSFPYFQFSSTGSSDYQDGSFNFIGAPDLTMKIIVNQAGRVRWLAS